MALLVERADVGTDGLNARLRVDGLGVLAREMRPATSEKRHDRRDDVPIRMVKRGGRKEMQLP